MTKTQYLLVKLAEEAAEIAQIALKTAHFGVHEKEHEAGPDNIERVRKEITDLRAVVRMLEEHDASICLISKESEIDAKIAKVTHYMKYSQSQGLVDED